MNKNRFYDQVSSVSQAVELLLVLPLEIQAIVAEGISRIAEKEFRANELLNELRSLGTEKVLAIYKSKQKKRACDQSTSVHQAINYLLVLSEENRIWISKRIIGLIAHLQDYLKTCRLYTTSPTTQTVSGITNTYIHQGTDEVTRYLKSVEMEFISLGKKRAPLPPSPNERSQPLEEVVMDEGSGLRIRGDLKA